ncbi:transposase, partial [Sansalvadorimonas sp. 2012CJ34-2]
MDAQQLIEQLLAVNAGQKREIENLKSQLDWFKRQLFGQKSEKRLVIENPDQISLADILASPSEPTTPV